MKLSILGKYGPYPKSCGNTSGYLLQDETSCVAFEMGSGVFAELSKTVPPQNVSAVIVSHLHNDHISDLGVYNYYLESLSKKGLLQRNIPLILPQVDCATTEFIKEMKYFQPVWVKNGCDVKIGDLYFTFFEVKHPVYCLGFACMHEGRKFVYSGDTDVCESLKGNLSGADSALLDGAFLPSQYRVGGPHMSAELCAKLAKELNFKAYITHLLPTNEMVDYESSISGFSCAQIVEEGDFFSV